MADYTPQDERLIVEAHKRLMGSFDRVCKQREDREMVERAFFLAKEAHAGVRRRSGEPYILHPIAVAQIVLDEIGLGTKSVIASLLHDVVEDTSYSVDDIESIFGEQIAYMVDGLTKMSGVKTADDYKSNQIEYFRKVLLTLSDDIRVVLIKIADRLHNMRTLGAMPSDKQIKIASETLYLFAPLAHRLGLYSIKTELEDLSFKYTQPEIYAEIEQKINDTNAERQQFINDFCTPIKEQLIADKYKFTIAGRVKSIYSIWTKMSKKGITFEEVYDTFAIRIIFTPTDNTTERAQCWNIFSVVTGIYNAKSERIRDWIAKPKTNGYEALHVTVMGQRGTWVEVQIRSERMEQIAERGFAAHWRYKQEHSDDDAFDKWLRDIRSALTNSDESNADFFDSVKLTLYTSEITAFTPKGEARTLPLGATVLDFAYDIHTNVGNKAIGAKINHKIATIFEPVKNGDQIEILLSDSSHPAANWLNHVTTAKARGAVTAYIKRQNLDNIERGQTLFENKMSELGITLSARLLHKITLYYKCNNKTEFYSKLGAGLLSLDNIKEAIKLNAPTKTLKFWGITLRKGDGDDAEESDDGVVKSLDEFIIAECCRPIPGDKIVGYRDGNAIYVHKTNCEILTRLAAEHGNRIVAAKEIEWSNSKANAYLSVLEINGIDRVGILLDIASVITEELGINIRELSIQSHDTIFEGKLSVYVRNTQSLDALITKVIRIKGINDVRRVV